MSTSWHITIHGDVATWLLAVGTLLLVFVTAVLARAAWRALRQVQAAISQLEEIKTDRHVEVFLEMARRWEGREMTEALQMEKGLRARELRRVFDKAERPRSRNPFRERAYTEAARKTVILLRVPNYFEDAALVARVGGLDEALVLENFGGVAMDEWGRWEKTIKAMQTTDDRAYTGFKELAKRALEDQERWNRRA